MLSVRVESVERTIRLFLLFILFLLGHSRTVVLYFLLVYVLFIFHSEMDSTEDHMDSSRVKMGI